MAITDIAQYAHLSKTDMEALGAELDAIRINIEGSRGTRDAAYIRRTIAFQRTLEVVARLAIAVGSSTTSWITGVAALAFAKIVENMEIGHNVGHGQWDWMNDPEIHSNTVGMGYGRSVVPMAVFAQLSPPHLHQRPRHG